jgi:arylsulfatase
MKQRAKQMACWSESFVPLRKPQMFNLRREPFERADENSNTCWDWIFDHAFLLCGVQALVAQQIQSFKDFSPRQKPASSNLDPMLEQLQESSGGGHH